MERRQATFRLDIRVINATNGVAWKTGKDKRQWFEDFLTDQLRSLRLLPANFEPIKKEPGFKDDPRKNATYRFDTRLHPILNQIEVVTGIPKARWLEEAMTSELQRLGLLPDDFEPLEETRGRPNGLGPKTHAIS